MVNPQDTVVKHSPCQIDIKNHLRSLKLAVGGECGGLIPNIPNNIETEADLLCRSRIFYNDSVSHCVRMPFIS